MKYNLTMAQALIHFLAKQYVVMDGIEYPFIQSIFGIFGHGNVTGIGEALENDPQGLTYYQGHNEQGMAHAAIAFAKQKNRLGIIPCTSSIGPGATNMITAAATATTNRIPLLLLPGDVFSCRQPDPVLQQLETTHDYTASVNDCFKPVSKYWDRINRPEQLMTACLQAMRVLTDPGETGAVTLCLPQDVQVEAYDYEASFFAKRHWFIDREAVSERALKDAISLLLSAKQPLIIAGGGVHYSLACATLANFASQHGIPVAETQAGKSALSSQHAMNVGGIGVTGSAAANQLAAEADLILVIGSRLQDFTTASKRGFRHPQCKLIHLNCSRFDAMKMEALLLKGDAKQGLLQLNQGLGSYTTSKAYQQRIQSYQEEWHRELTQLGFSEQKRNDKDLKQTVVLDLLNQWVTKEDVIIAAAGSLPGDVHRLWQSKTAKDYHVEYAYSCMGYEVAAGLGVRLAQPSTGEVYVLVGDGSFLMMHSELITSLQEGKKITILLFDNHGYQCIKNLQQSQGSQGFGNEFRYRDKSNNQLTGQYLAIDFCQYASALGATTFYADSYPLLEQAFFNAKREKKSSLIVIPILPQSMSSGYHTWWRVGVSATSKSATVCEAYQQMEQQIALAKTY